MQRAIEGELTTTIQSLESVRSARVHLALPQMNGFFREQQKPSASVVLTLHNGRTLDRNQIAGIVRVVSGSVPELSARAVSVVDSSGALLSAPGDDETAQGLDSQQLQYRREVEAGHLTRVLALLEPVVGRDNVRASVSADIDFSQVMQTAEAYRPNQGGDAVAAVREQRSEESTQPGANTTGGVPGAGQARQRRGCALAHHRRPAAEPLEQLLDLGPRRVDQVNPRPRRDLEGHVALFQGQQAETACPPVLFGSLKVGAITECGGLRVIGAAAGGIQLNQCSFDFFDRAQHRLPVMRQGLCVACAGGFLLCGQRAAIKQWQAQAGAKQPGLAEITRLIAAPVARQVADQREARITVGGGNADVCTGRGQVTFGGRQIRALREQGGREAVDLEGGGGR